MNADTVTVPPVDLKAQGRQSAMTTVENDVKKSQYSHYHDKENNPGRSTRQPTTAMAVEHGEEVLFDNLENQLQSIENEYMIRKTQTKLMR